MNGSAAESRRLVAGVRGRCALRGVTLAFGRGRVVIVGEAALFSAQVLRTQSQPDFRFGMNAPGNDDQQFVLNTLHWLSGDLP
jgi:hypothetical protein